jgi:hypothetical protein
MWVLKTWNGKEYVPWTSGANPSNINKLVQLHELVRPGIPFVVDKAR